jgi:hypothetical protein
MQKKQAIKAEVSSDGTPVGSEKNEDSNKPSVDMPKTPTPSSRPGSQSDKKLNVEQSAGSKSATPQMSVVEQSSGPKSAAPQLLDLISERTWITTRIEPRILKFFQFCYPSYCLGWTLLETTYTDALKFIMRGLRREEELTGAHFHLLTTSFRHLLNIVDAKQTLVDAFVREYNDMEDDFM